MCLVSYSKTPYYSSKEKLKDFTGRPKWAYVEITRECSHYCKWCYGGFNEDLTDRMSLVDFELLLSKLKSLGIVQITLAGGEPTEHPDFDRMIELAGKDFILNIASHGDWKDPELAKKMRVSGVRQVQFNYQGSKRHDSVHGVRGSFDSQIKAIRSCVDEEIEVVCCLTVGSYNLKDVRPIFKEMVDLGVTRLRVWETTGVGNSFRRELEAKDIFEVTTEVAGELGFGFIQSYDPVVKGDVGVPCLALSNLYMYINCKGEHIFCGAVPSQLNNPISNVLVDSVEDILLRSENFIKVHTRSTPYCMARTDSTTIIVRLEDINSVKSVNK